MTAAARKPRLTVAISHCAECPFSDAGEPELEPGEPWLCMAVADHQDCRALDGYPRRPDAVGTPPPPPRWCPLRRQDHLVVLKPRSRR